MQTLQHHHTPRVLNSDQLGQCRRGSATEHVMIPCHLAFFHNFVCCGVSGDIELAVAVCYLVNLICPCLGECSAYNFSTTHGSEHTCLSKGSSTSPFADCLCQNITQNSVLRKEKKGSDIDAQRDASCTKNAARLRHLHASDQHSRSLARLWTPSGCEQVSAHRHLSVGRSQQRMEYLFFGVFEHTR